MRMQVFRGTDACVSAVLDRDQTVADPHNVERGLFASATDGAKNALVVMPAPAPRLLRTPASVSPSSLLKEDSELVAVSEVGW